MRKGLAYMLSNQQVQDFQQKLEQQKKELKEHFGDENDFGLRRSLVDSTGELSSYDNHPADEGTELFEREKDLALYEHYQIELADIDKGLKAIEEGSYGKCEVCSIDIPYERLEAMPTTRFCINHSPSQHTSDDRPIEESVLRSSFGGFVADKDHESVGYDGEDSWQDVARYGTSDTPADQVQPTADYNDTYIEAQENVGYVEDYENFAGVDLYGDSVTIYRNAKYENYVDMLEEDDVQTILGDLPASEKDPYVEEDNED